MSELVVFQSAFPGGVDNDNVRFRTVIWIIAEAVLAITVLTNFMSPHRFKWIFRISAAIIAIDFVVLFIALPIGVSQRYGFQSADWVFTYSFNGTGAPPAWNWILSFLSTQYVLIGFDAAAHIAEETKNPSLAAARGVFWSCAFSAVLGFRECRKIKTCESARLTQSRTAALLLLFLFCSPSVDTLYELAAPQPLVLLFQLALGTGGQIVLSVIAIFGLMVVSA